MSGTWAVQDNVAVFLVDTGDGLILIDTGLNAETCYLVIDRIWQSRPQALRHQKDFPDTLARRPQLQCPGHPGTHRRQNLRSGSPGEDEAEHQKHEGKVGDMRMVDGRMQMNWVDADSPEGKASGKKPDYPYVATHFYDDDTPIVMGNMTIRTRLCPGHTPGVTSFFFEDTDEETGKTYKVALHGGPGCQPHDAS